MFKKSVRPRDARTDERTPRGCYQHTHTHARTNACTSVKAGTHIADHSYQRAQGLSEQAGAPPVLRQLLHT